MLYLVLLTYVEPIDRVDAWLSAHRAFLAAHIESGTFLLAGRRQPRTGGLIIARADSAFTLERIMMQDPFVRSGVARFDIVAFEPSAGLPDWMEAATVVEAAS
ncbi:YciI family protein [Uliginosibacterium sp. sgz301328]|uniref:YciI family protein n=1 Tax=Uliginosibacterium sp. sgz301328 TaxID=3243764 RepID=UPI00359E476F